MIVWFIGQDFCLKAEKYRSANRQRKSERIKASEYSTGKRMLSDNKH